MKFNLLSAAAGIPAIAALICILSCGTQHPPVLPGYGLMVYDSIRDADYFLSLPALTVETDLPRETMLPPHHLTIATRGDLYYFMDMERKIFAEYRVTPTGLQKQRETSMAAVPYEPYDSWMVWAGEHTLLLGNRDGDKFGCSVIDPEAMKLLRYVTLQTPPAPAGLNYTAVSAQFVQQRLLLFYTYQKGWMREHLTPPSDTMYANVYGYPELQLQHTFPDTRTTWPGSYNIWGPNTLHLHDTAYVLGQPGGRTGNHPSALSAVLRATGNGFDSSYLFPLTDNKTTEAYTLHNIGYGKAITKVVASAGVTRFDDYLQQETAHYELLDLVARTRKAIPAGNIRLSFNHDVLADDTTVYLPVYLGNNKSRILLYHLKTGSITPGITVTGRILRMDKLRK
ncbi:hypothetical protein [Chitinophaga solisilvae]|uniref:hypothetical protein n=1 Tax=Chitinophaga solisilvae TaxID=1233460 RepID=UPI001369E137|nr:hypothetical protein [Chitinophaga solisilvae]